MGRQDAFWKKNKKKTPKTLKLKENTTDGAEEPTNQWPTQTGTPAQDQPLM